MATNGEQLAEIRTELKWLHRMLWLSVALSSFSSGDTVVKVAALLKEALR